MGDRWATGGRQVGDNIIINYSMELCLGGDIGGDRWGQMATRLGLGGERAAGVKNDLSC